MKPIRKPESEARLQGLGFLLERLLHDLKQPLNQMRVVAQDVRLDVKKGRLEVAELATGMAEIEGAVDQLVRRLDQLRAFSISAPLGASSESFVLEDACKKSVRALTRSDSTELVVQEQYQPGLALTLSNRAYLELALLELLENARQAALEARRAPARIEITARERGFEAVIVVRDNGAGAGGVDSEIFEPFFTTRANASGLGLPMARALVEQIHGRLTLLKSDDTGSEFEITLPSQG